MRGGTLRRRLLRMRLRPLGSVCGGGRQVARSPGPSVGGLRRRGRGTERVERVDGGREESRREY